MSIVQRLNISDAKSLAHRFFKDYDEYKHRQHFHFHIRHVDLFRALLPFRSNPDFEFKTVGLSVEGREITSIRFGTGKVQVAMWSQMHGDEPTATLSILDFLNFLQKDDAYNDFRSMLKNELSIHIIPMVNPDGAERFIRRNAQGIDINRDALALSSPEARMLKDYVLQLNPDYGFNLHDQEPYYAVGNTSSPVTLAFLAPPPDAESGVAKNNYEIAQSLLGNLVSELSPIYPSEISRYAADYEPRAFGDFFQHMGISTILIESGACKHDGEKRRVRKAGFLAVLTGCALIAQQKVEGGTEHYHAIPDNKKMKLFDLMIRNVIIDINGVSCTTDIGIRRVRKMVKGSDASNYISIIEDIGELSVFGAFDTVDAKGMFLQPGKVYGDYFTEKTSISDVNLIKLLENGYTHIGIASEKPKNDFTSLPCNLTYSVIEPNNFPSVGVVPNFTLCRNGKPEIAIINGFVYNLMTGLNLVKNALVV
ncbi:MAG: M14 family zinc carboxypeptidase [Cyclobacteriaceae bacterium]